MDRQRPFSRAYRSFYPGKEDEGIVIHLGSGAVPAGTTSNSKDSVGLKDEGAGNAGDFADERRLRAEELFDGECVLLPSERVRSLENAVRVQVNT